MRKLGKYIAETTTSLRDFDGYREAVAEAADGQVFVRVDIVTRLLGLIGKQGECSRCGATIWWLTMPKTGKNAPYNAAGLNHFADCPHADKFRKPTKKP